MRQSVLRCFLMTCLAPLTLISVTISGLYPLSSHSEPQANIRIDDPVLNRTQYDQMLRKTVRDSSPAPKENDIWGLIRGGFRLNGYEQPRVNTELNWYASHSQYQDRVSTRATPFLYFILQELQKRDMPTEIALLPIVESAFQAFANSPGGAAGIWQFMPATAKRYGLEMNWWYDGRRDVYASTVAALEFLLDLQDHYNGDWLLALAAYNTGQGTVDRSIQENIKAGKKTQFWDLDLPKETRDYVPKLLAIASILADPDAFNIQLRRIPVEPYFEQVYTDGQLDLALAADLAGIQIEELFALNPAFNRWATPPQGPHYLLLPRSKADRFRANLAALDPHHRVQWKRHRVAPGETLERIAVRHHTTTNFLKEVNQLASTTVQAHDILIIPVANAALAGGVLTAAFRKQRLEESARGGEKIKHVVARGDTLWDIARKYDVDINELAAWNEMSPNQPLLVGKKLLVILDETDNKVVLPNAPLPIKPERKHKTVYTVRAGDSLDSISAQFRVSVSQLKRWNDLEHGEYIQPGQALNVLVDASMHVDNH